MKRKLFLIIPLVLLLAGCSSGSKEGKYFRDKSKRFRGTGKFS